MYIYDGMNCLRSRSSEPSKPISLKRTPTLFQKGLGELKNPKKSVIIYVIYPKARLAVIIGHIRASLMTKFILIWEADVDFR